MKKKKKKIPSMPNDMEVNSKKKRKNTRSESNLPHKPININYRSPPSPTP